MKIECQSCGAQHDLDPPSWVLSSGRAFRFRCSVCGHSQMVEPPRATVDGGVTQPAGATPPRSAVPRPSGATPASPPRAATATQTLPRETFVAREPLAATAPAGIYLRQEGKVYLVKDWATLQRWIMERRVAREDDVSDDGARWDTVGGRPELGSFFAAVEALEAAEIAGLRGAASPPVEPTAERSYGGSALARLDDETEGVPLGLPPLPTEDLDPTPAPEEAWPAQPPSRLAPASPPEDDLHDVAPPILRDEPSLSDAPDPGWDEPPVEPVEADAAPALSMPFFAEAEADPVDPPSVPEWPNQPARSDAPAALSPSPTLTPEAALYDSFDEPSVPLEESPSLLPGDPPASAPVEAFDEPFGTFDEPAPAKASEEPTEERPVEHADDDDLSDPFGAFEPASRDADALAAPAPPRPGPPGWLWLSAAVILTAAAALGVYVAYARGWFAPAATTEPIVAVQAPVPPPMPPAPTPEPVADTPAPAADTEPPVADTDTTMASAQPPVEAPQPPVEAPKPPAPKPSVEAPQPPVEAPKPPAPKPPAPKPAGSSVAQLRERGWKALDQGDTSAAVDTFEKATAAAPNDPEAWYGLGYARREGRQTEAARSALCKASSLAKGALKAEIDRILQRDQSTCP